MRSRAAISSSAIGGLFLLFKATREIYAKMEMGKGASVVAVLVQSVLLDRWTRVRRAQDAGRTRSGAGVRKLHAGHRATHDFRAWRSP